MKILITGANGFIGKNLCAHLKNSGYLDLLEYTRDTPPEDLDAYAAGCDFVFHLAGVNRPTNPEGFAENEAFTETLLKVLERNRNQAPIIFASSTQAELRNPYGQSKRQAEKLLRSYAKRTETNVYIYRLPGVFGKWCRPYYNNVVATFCHAIANGLPIKVDDPDADVTLAYIDDVIKAWVRKLQDATAQDEGLCAVEPVYHTTVGTLAEMLASFHEGRTKIHIPDMGDAFTTKLYSTYISYLPENCFGYPLITHADERGSFTEFLRTEHSGQISINVSKPGFTRGGHWHHTKIEKIFIASGSGVIHFQQLNGGKRIEYPVCGTQPMVIEVPPGYVHAVENTGSEDLVMVIWSNRNFDVQNPDTYPAGFQPFEDGAEGAMPSARKG